MQMYVIRAFGAWSEDEHKIRDMLKALGVSHNAALSISEGAPFECDTAMADSIRMELTEEFDGAYASFCEVKVITI